MSGPNSYKCAELADKIEKQGLCLICDYPDFYGRKDEQIVPPDTNIQRDLIVAALRAYGSHGPNDEQVWLENELMACMQIVAPGMGSAMPDEITYAIMVTAIRRLIECDTERYEALLERWQKRTRATQTPSKEQA